MRAIDDRRRRIEPEDHEGLIDRQLIARPAFAPTERSKRATTRLIVTAQAMIVTIEMPAQDGEPSRRGEAGSIRVKKMKRTRSAAER